MNNRPKDLAFAVGCSALLGLAVVGTTKQPQVVPAFKIAFEYEAAPPPNFRLWCDDGIVKTYSSSEIRLGKSTAPNAEGLFTYTLSAPELTATTHTCLVTATLSGENYTTEPKSDPITIRPECNMAQVLPAGTQLVRLIH
jgi:hypothetical protein